MRVLMLAAMAAAAQEGSAFLLSPSSSSFMKAQGSLSSPPGRFSGVTVRSSKLRSNHLCSIKASLQGQDVMNKFDAIGDSAIQKLMDALPLRESNHVEGLGASSWVEGSFSGSVQGWTAEPKVGWISKSSMKNSDGSSGSCNLAVLMGPSYDTPHLWVDMSVTPQEIVVNLDFPARVDLAANKDYIAEYYKSASAWYDSLMNNPATTPIAGGKGLNDRILASPMSLSLSMPKDQQSLDMIERAVDEQVSTWCSWIQGAREVNRMQRGSMFARDTQMQRMRFSSLVVQTGFLALHPWPDMLTVPTIPIRLPQRSCPAGLHLLSVAPCLLTSGSQLAAAMVGPGDEQYVGSAGDNSE